MGCVGREENDLGCKWMYGMMTCKLYVSLPLIDVDDEFKLTAADNYLSMVAFFSSSPHFNNNPSRHNHDSIMTYSIQLGIQ